MSELFIKYRRTGSIQNTLFFEESRGHKRKQKLNPVGLGLKVGTVYMIMCCVWAGYKINKTNPAFLLADGTH